MNIRPSSSVISPDRDRMLSHGKGRRALPIGTPASNPAARTDRPDLLHRLRQLLLDALPRFRRSSSRYRGPRFTIRRWVSGSTGHGSTLLSLWLGGPAAPDDASVLPLMPATAWRSRRCPTRGWFLPRPRSSLLRREGRQTVYRLAPGREAWPAHPPNTLIETSHRGSDALPPPVVSTASGSARLRSATRTPLRPLNRGAPISARSQGVRVRMSGTGG